MTSPRDDATTRLTTLLDRLATELLGGPDAEVEAALRDTGRARTAALYEVRELLTHGPPAGAPDGVGSVTDAPTSAALTRGTVNRH